MKSENSVSSVASCSISEVPIDQRKNTTMKMKRKQYLLAAALMGALAFMPTVG